MVLRVAPAGELFLSLGGLSNGASRRKGNHLIRRELENFNELEPHRAARYRMKRNAPEHPKVYRLAAKLGIPHALAVGYLELLWHYTAKFAPQGDIGRYPDESIARALHYSGKAHRIVSALTEEGWLDVSTHSRLVVHDWHEHADEATKKTLLRKGLPFLSLASNLSGQVLDKDRIIDGQLPDSVEIKSASRASVPLPLPEPLPLSVSPQAETPAPRKRFTAPTPDEVRAYGKEIGFDVDAEKFCDFYAAKGWVVGKSPMKDWKAAVRTWRSGQHSTPSMFNKRPVEETTLFVPKPRPAEDDGPDDEPWDLDSMFRAGAPQ